MLRDTGEEVAIKVQRPGVEPVILRDLFIFRALASLFNGFAQERLGCNAQLIVDEFGEKIMEELDYSQEARNIQVRGRKIYETSLTTVLVDVVSDQRECVVACM